MPLKQIDVCGNCGCTLADMNALCAQCGADHWIQHRDFTLPELNVYIAEACSKLDVSREDLQRICNGDEELYQTLIADKLPKYEKVS